MKTLSCPRCKERIEPPVKMGGLLRPVCRVTLLNDVGDPPIGATWTKEDVEED